MQVTEEELAVPYDKISLDVWNSDALEFDSGIAGSRGTRVNTASCYMATEEVRKRLIEIAARHWGCPEDVLSVHRGEIRRTDLEETISWQDLLAATGEEVTGRGHVVEGGPGQARITSFVCQVAEMQVDPETGESKLLKLTSAHDIGRIVNPIGHQGQINGGVIQGVGYALMEEVKLEDGRVTTLSLGDYKLPNIMDIPELVTVNLQSEAGYGPYAIRGIGEGPHIPVAAAVANGVKDACGARVRDLPVTSEKVYRALKDGE
jgi:xanthine dehydrogenase molybdenum-binding subunit